MTSVQSVGGVCSSMMCDNVPNAPDLLTEIKMADFL